MGEDRTFLCHSNFLKFDISRKEKTNGFTPGFRSGRCEKVISVIGRARGIFLNLIVPNILCGFLLRRNDKEKPIQQTTLNDSETFPLSCVSEGRMLHPKGRWSVGTQTMGEDRDRGEVVHD
jgi:hypothetical protein